MLLKKFDLTTCVTDADDEIFEIRYMATIELDFVEVLFNLFNLSGYAKKVVVNHLRDCASKLKLDYISTTELEKICDEFSGMFFDIYKIRKYEKAI